MNSKRTLLSAALAAAIAASFGAQAQNVSEGEIDRTTGQTQGTPQGGQANTNELQDPAAREGQSGSSTTGETTGQGQGVIDSGGEAAAGTHRDQGGDPTRGASGHTGTDAGATPIDPEKSQQ